MRIRFIRMLATAAAVFSSISPPSFASSDTTFPVRFIKSIDAGTPISIAVDPEGRIYAGQSDGTIRVMTFEGLHILTMEGRDDNGRKILDQPVGLAFHDKHVYVVDRSACKVVIFSNEGKYIDDFGSKGSGYKRFKGPTGICLNDNVILVTDYGEDRVQMFGPNGVFMGALTGSADMSSSADMIKGPVGVAVDHRGYMYVPCAGSNRTMVFSPNGDLYNQLDQGGNPVAIAMAEEGFYVADQESLTVNKYDFAGKRLFSFGSRGKMGPPFVSISGICVDSAGKLYVADRKLGQIHIFYVRRNQMNDTWKRVPAPTSVKWLRNIPVRARKIIGAGSDTLYAVDDTEKRVVRIGRDGIEKSIPINDCEPVSIAMDPSGVLWVLDGKAGQVIKLDKKFQISFRFGSIGRQPGQFLKPTDIAVTREAHIFITDPECGRVQEFDADGTLLKTFPGVDAGESFSSPSAVTLDEHDILYVLDGEQCSVTAFAPSGKRLLKFGRKGKSKGDWERPVSLFATSHEVFVLDAGSDSVKVFTPKGVFLRQFGCRGTGKGDFKDPFGICMTDENILCVSDTGNKRVQVLANMYSPSPPGDTVAKGGMHSVRIEWKRSPEPTVSAYRVYRSLNQAGPYEKLVSLPADAYLNGYTDTDVDFTRTYFYRVTAKTKDGKESGASRPVSAAPTKYFASAPTGLAAVAGECSVDLTWKPSVESFVIGYVISRLVGDEFQLVGTSNSAKFSEGLLMPDTSYSYEVSPLSSDGQRGAAADITIRTRAFEGPPLDVRVTEMKDIFVNSSDWYTTEGIGRVKVINHTCEGLSNVRVSFWIKGIMEEPYEHTIETLGPAMEEELVIKADLGSRLLNVTEDTLVPAEITVSLMAKEQSIPVTQSHEIQIYERHKMTWDQKERFAVFVTPDDPSVSKLVHSVLKPFDSACDNIQRAALIFDALGVMGIERHEKANRPSPLGRKEPIDRIQYPRETLELGSGDTKDLIALYAAALECIGIPTLLIRQGERIGMMFFSGIRDNGSENTMDNMFVAHEMYVWVPVEVSLMGQPFLKAWKEGSRSHARGSTGEFEKEVFYTREAWNTFRPAILPPSNGSVATPKKEAVEKIFANEVNDLRRMVIRFRGAEYLDTLSKNPKDVPALMQLALIKAKAGEEGAALTIFKKVLELNPRHAGALNNVGNIYFVTGRYHEARSAYRAATELEPQDALIWINLGRCCQKLNLVPEARDCLQKARALNPLVSKWFGTLFSELPGTY